MLWETISLFSQVAVWFVITPATDKNSCCSISLLRFGVVSVLGFRLPNMCIVVSQSFQPFSKSYGFQILYCCTCPSQKLYFMKKLRFHEMYYLLKIIVSSIRTEICIHHYRQCNVVLLFLLWIWCTMHHQALQGCSEKNTSPLLRFGGLGLAYAHWCIWNYWPMGTCCTTQRTLFSILWYVGKESEREWMHIHV